MKKLIAILLALSIFGSIGFAFDVKGLTDLGLNFSSNEAELVLRKDFVSNITALMNLSPMPGSPQLYSDVTPDMQSYGDIMAAYNANIIYGTHNMKFRPDEPITYNEAINIFIKLLGYDAHLKQGQSDIAIAANIGLTKGFIFAGSAWVTYGNLIKMYSNLTKIPVLQANFNGTEFSINESETVYSIFRDLKFKEGYVDAIDGVSLLNNISAPEGTVVISGITYYVENVDVSNYLGMRVRYMYEECDYGDVVRAIAPMSKCEVVDVNLRDVDSCTSMTVEYISGEKKIAKARFNSDAVILYNGALITHYSDSIFNGDNGTVRFINNDSDSFYDIIIIKEYEDWVIGRISNDVVHDKYRVDNMGAPLTLDLSNVDEKRLKRQNGTTFETEDLLKDNILSVLKTDTGVITEVLLSLNVVEGVVESKSTDNTVIIDGKEYYLTNFFTNNYSVNVGESVKLYLNVFSNAVCLHSYGAGGYKYGYFMKLTYDSDTEVMYAKLLTEDNKIERYEFAKKFMLDGRRQAYTYSNVLSSFSDAFGFAPQIVRYSIDKDGFLAKLDSLNCISANGETSSNSLNNSYPKTSGKYFKNNSTFGGKLPVKSTSIVFKVPDESAGDKRGSFDDKYYTISNADSIGDAEVPVAGYGVDSQNLIPDAFVIYTESASNGAGIPDADRMCIIADMSVVLNSEGEAVTKIDYYKGKELLSNCFSNDQIIAENLPLGATLKIGDVVRVSTDSFGEITGLQYIYSVDDGLDDTTAFQNNISNGTMGSNGTFVLSKMYFYKQQDGFGFFAKKAEIEAPGEITLSQMCASDLNAASVVIYDPNETVKVRLASIDEVSESYGDVAGDMVIVKTYYNILQTIYVVRQ